MKKENERYKIIFGITLVLAFIFTGLTNNAFGFLGFGDTAKWKEEVLLHDGSKIIVERWQKHGGSHEPGQKPGVSDQSIIFTLPGTKKIVKWKDEYSKELSSSNFDLVALHILKGIPYIITTPSLCLSYNEWGRPNPPYVIFKYEKNEWKRIEIADLPIDFKNINFVVDTLTHEKKLVSQRLISSDMVRELNRGLTQEEYKNVVRTKLEGVGCPVLVPVKNGWESPGGAKAPMPITPAIARDKQ